jgi:hypothetical protein
MQPSVDLLLRTPWGTQLLAWIDFRYDLNQTAFALFRELSKLCSVLTLEKSADMRNQGHSAPSLAGPGTCILAAQTNLLGAPSSLYHNLFFLPRGNV